MTQEELVLRDAIEFYNDDPRRRSKLVHRARGQRAFAYETEDGRRCACSLFMTDQARSELKSDPYLNGERIDILLGKFGNRLFESQYKTCPTYFWVALQHLHDHDKFWDRKGITGAGKAFVLQSFGGSGELALNSLGLGE